MAIGREADQGAARDHRTDSVVHRGQIGLFDQFNFFFRQIFDTEVFGNDFFDVRTFFVKEMCIRDRPSP